MVHGYALMVACIESETLPNIVRGHYGLKLMLIRREKGKIMPQETNKPQQPSPAFVHLTLPQLQFDVRKLACRYLVSSVHGKIK